MKYYLMLLITVGIGAYLHFVNLSPYYIYPDSYQNILIAENIHTYHSVVGTLGKAGQVWPDYFGWTRPGYAALILGISSVAHNFFTAAQIITFFATLIAPLISFFVLKRVFNSVAIALCAAVLTALSANYAIWGGLILTEGVGVLSILLLLWSFFTTLSKGSEYAEIRDLVMGSTLAIATLIRFEYILWLIPLISAISIHSPTPWKKLLNILAAMVFILSIVGTQLFPLHASVAKISSQNYVLEISGLILLCLFLVTTFVVRILKPREDIYKWASAASLGALSLLAVALVFNFYQVSAPRGFFNLDILLGITFLFGIYRLHYHAKKYQLIVWLTVSLGIFSLFYYQINPLMQRYWTHMLPLLLIPASYGLYDLWSRKLLFKILTIFLVSIQIFNTYNGIRYWSNGEYFTSSYAQEAAVVVKKYAHQDQLLLVSFPESYYSLVHVSTHSLTDTKPYLYIPESFNSRDVLVVQDMGMRDQFPHFSHFIDTQLQQYLIAQQWANRKYHFAQRSEKETAPVKIYKISLQELRQVLYANSI